MNLGEGTRRLALLIGVVGAIVGGVAAYSELQGVLDQRARHNRFEALANLDAVKHERKCRLAGIFSGCGDLPNDFVVKAIQQPSPQLSGSVDNDSLARKYGGIAVEPTQKSNLPPGVKIDAKTGERTPKQYLDDNGNPISEPHPVIPPPPDGSGIVPVVPPAPPGWVPVESDGVTFDWSKSIPIPSIVMKNGIKSINWTHDYGIDSIEMEDSGTVYPTPLPRIWMYFLIALYPLGGFFAPWGTIRAVRWVGAGFVQPPK